MEINKKIDLQVASLKTLLESLKLETVRYLAGNERTHARTLSNISDLFIVILSCFSSATVFSCLAIALGVYRVMR